MLGDSQDTRPIVYVKAMSRAIHEARQAIGPMQKIRELIPFDSDDFLAMNEAIQVLDRIVCGRMELA